VRILFLFFSRVFGLIPFFLSSFSRVRLRLLRRIRPMVVLRPPLLRRMTRVHLLSNILDRRRLLLRSLGFRTRLEGATSTVKVNRVYYYSCYALKPRHGNVEQDWEWIFDTKFANFLQRVKIKIHGTRITNYLEGDYEGKKGRILGAVRSGAAFEQTATVAFEDGEQRSVQMRYIDGVLPSAVGEEAVVIRGPEKGKLVVMREKEGDEEEWWGVSLSKELVFRRVKGSDMVVLWGTEAS